MLVDLVEPYIRSRVRRGDITPLTAREQRSTLVRFATVYGRRLVPRLSRVDIARWQESTDGLSPGTRAKQFSDVRCFCRWLVEQGKVRRDPTVGMKAPRRPRTVPRALTHDAVRAILVACPDQRARLIAVLMVQQGLRRAEVCGVELGDIDTGNRTIRITGKGGHERVLPLTAETLDELRVYLGLFPAASGPLVRSYPYPHRGLSPSTVGHMVSDIMRDAAVKQAPGDGVSAHALRHTMATDVLRAGASIRDVQAALGHRHLATTETYLPLLVHGLERAMAGRTYTLPLTPGVPCEP